MSNESIGKVLIVATGLCVVCSILVSTAAVTLRPAQELNKKLDRQSNILAAAGLTADTKEAVQQVYDEKIEAKLIELASGSYSDKFSADEFDQREAAKSSEIGKEISSDQDHGNIKRRSQYSTIYLIKDGTNIDGVILPIHGKGLWSTMYGFIALEPDLKTVKGLGFYEHGETPGLGGEVDNEKWKALWPGKLAFADGSDDVAIGLIKGAVDTSRPDAKYQIDGLSGATITARGVTNLLRYWLGPDGFGPYLNNARANGLSSRS